MHSDGREDKVFNISVSCAGTVVAVKVRHPGVSQAIQRDFALMMRMARIASIVPFIRELRLEDTLAQFAAPLREQVTIVSLLLDPGVGAMHFVLLGSGMQTALSEHCKFSPSLFVSPGWLGINLLRIVAF